MPVPRIHRRKKVIALLTILALVLLAVFQKITSYSGSIISTDDAFKIKNGKDEITKSKDDNSVIEQDQQLPVVEEVAEKKIDGNNIALSLLDLPELSESPIIYNRIGNHRIQTNIKDEAEHVGKFLYGKDYIFSIPLKEENAVRELPMRSSDDKNKEFPKMQRKNTHKPKSSKKIADVRDVFRRNWQSYYEHALKYDEFSPLTLTGSDSYFGWSLTLIDSLDTLLLMGFREEFKDSVAYINKIDFTKILNRDDLPIFEVNVRVLGGLLSAYDLSNDRRLLSKAIQVGDLLLRSFDTYNNFPVLYYNLVENQQSRKFKFASMRNYLSELGSLSLEFTRLSIITDDLKYFQYSMNLINAVIESKDRYFIADFIPNELDLSGCSHVLDEEEISKMYNGKAPKNSKKAILINDNNNDTKIVYCTQNEDRKFIKPSSLDNQFFSLEGKSDSFYEYLLKLYILLDGNLDQQYLEFFKNSKEKIKKFLIFKPKVPNNENLLFLNEVSVKKLKENNKFQLNQSNSVSHASCFAGGFFALSSRILNDKNDLELAHKLTKSCADFDNRLGLFPESFNVDSCDSTDDEKCVYDESARMEWIKEHSNNLMNSDEKHDTKKKVVVDGENIYEVETSMSRANAPISEDNKRLDAGNAANQPIYLNNLDPRYLMRPQLVESLFIMFRITGADEYRDIGWKLFQKLNQYTAVNIKIYSFPETVNAPIKDVTKFNHGNGYDKSNYENYLESFWFAETLKYFYLLFEDSKILSLDDWVFNTEGHPLKKQKYIPI
ncbi:hypothetical protein PACTADRAFT_49467 [Pachysolen tannophilus NRRL Y-2460]|uniref:alpha-1,2-Mannosidase n=1 Tax=Pachysolen tannophilus NRRL Y-2460 TaxID=669874 RepID=A0A1E4TWK4_PACTA|nr:hypothetical protein PACTADRAFT_49467 [Pachysolen tannophilus NRRL Y-2460]